MSKDGMRRVGAWLPAIAYMAAIFVLSAQSKLPSPPGILGWDKLQHLLAYVVLGLLLYRACVISPIVRTSPYWTAFVLGALYGAFDEYHQSFVPGRDMSALDWLADVLGLIAALILMRILEMRGENGGQ
ncbi:MAG: VanZ family protein [Armatimonadetes bacterium]|nr:VanZ family protein [Armatimonadota bacterium]